VQLFSSRKNLPKILCKNFPKIFYKNINKNLLNYYKNFLILPKLLNLNTNNMKKFEFICKTDLVTGDKVYLTREDGVYVPSSLRLNKDQAYDIFIKLTNQEPMEMFEVLETKTSPNE
jgi:hypothetical protein